MNVKAKPGDVVELADKESGFTDPATGFDISRDQQVKLGDSIGERTQQAILSGGLLVVQGRASKQRPAGDGESGGGGSKSDGDFPEDFPGRDVFVAEGLTLAEVRELDEEGLVAIKGIGKKTAESVLAYGK